MISKDELLELLNCTETYRVEKTISTTNMDKFCEAICAFANDMPNSGKCGYLLIGVNDEGSRNKLHVDDELLKKITAIRTSGNILPLPVMNVDYITFDDGDVLVVEVTPSILPPVRYRGRTFIRVGPRKDIATKEEEDKLIERRSVNFPTFDTTPCLESTIDDIDVKLFLNEYLPVAIDNDILASDTRSVKEQMASLRLYNLKHDCPTYAAIILFGKNPEYFLMGDYIQHVTFDGINNASEIVNEKEFKGNLVKMLPRLDAFVDALIQKRPIPISALREDSKFNYPKWAIRELLMNAVMHRDYKSNTPTKFYQYQNRLEIVNAGGLFGNARPENFPNVNDYRNPIVAEAMKLLGYVNKFNRGISRVQEELIANGNGNADFRVDKITVFEVKINSVEANETLSLTNLIKTQYYPNQSTDFDELFLWFSGETINADDISPLKITNLITNSIKTTEILNKLQYHESLSGKELLESVGLSVQSYNRKRFISPLLDTNLILGIGSKTKIRYSLTILGYLYLRYISESNDK